MREPAKDLGFTPTKEKINFSFSFLKRKIFILSKFKYLIDQGYKIVAMYVFSHKYYVEYDENIKTFQNQVIFYSENFFV